MSEAKTLRIELHLLTIFLYFCFDKLLEITFGEMFDFGFYWFSHFSDAFFHPARFLPDKLIDKEFRHKEWSPGDELTRAVNLE
jgi:hypothetical protein